MVSIAAFQAVDPGSIPGRRNIFSTSGRHQQEKNTILTFPKIYSIPGVQKGFPTPGIEPGPPGWEPGMLTTRPLEESTADVKPDLQLGVTFSLSQHIMLATTMVTSGPHIVSYRIVSRDKPSYRIDIVSSRKKAYRPGVTLTVEAIQLIMWLR